VSAPGKPHPIRGYFYIAAATFCWGISAVLGKAVFTGRLMPGANASGIDPLILSQTRTTIAFLVLLPMLVLLRGTRALKMRRGDFVRCLLIGTAGISASNFFYYVAIEKTTVATGITLQYFSPILVLLYMVARGLQRATVPRMSAVVLAVFGSALAIGLWSGAQLKLNVVGVAAGLAAAVGFSFYNVVGHSLLERYDRWVVFTYSMLGASLLWAVVNPPWKIVAAHYSAQQWEFMLLFATISMLIAYSFYYAGLQHLDATRAIVTSCLEPVFAIVIAAVYLGEALTWTQAVGVVVVLLATIIVQLREKGAIHRGDAEAQRA
jgi:drug/metabolite transporter, DME family